MKLRLLILLAAALAAAAAPAAGQTIKSLGYNTTNGQIVYSGTNDLRFPATIRIGTNQSGFSSGGQFLTVTDGAGGVAMIIGTNAITSYDPIAFSSTGNAATTRTNLGLGETNTVTFSNIQLGLFGTASATGFAGRSSGGQFVLYGTNVSSSVPAFYGWDGFNNAAMSAGTSRTNLGLPGTWLTNTDVTNFRTAIGLGTTNSVAFSNITASGTLAVTGNVTLSGVNNTMPNATNAASGASLMTRSLTDLQMFGLLGLYDPVRLASGTVTGTNGGGFDNYGSSYDLRTGTNAAGAVVYNAGSFTRQTTAGSGANAAWANRIVVAWPFNRASTNNEVRLQYGRSTSANTHAALTARGIGIRINGNNMFFETHDGTTAFETTNAVPLTHNFGQDVFWAISESGVVRFYRGQNTLLATVTNNVPTSGVSDNNTGWIISISNTTAANSIFRVLNNPGFVLQQ